MIRLGRDRTAPPSYQSNGNHPNYDQNLHLMIWLERSGSAPVVSAKSLRWRQSVITVSHHRHQSFCFHRHNVHHNHNFDEMVIIIKMMMMLRKMMSGSNGSAPRFATHQSCQPHSCHLKEVLDYMIIIIMVMLFHPDGFQNTKTRHGRIFNSDGCCHRHLPPSHRPPLHRPHHHVRRPQDHLAKNEESEWFRNGYFDRWQWWRYNL